MKKLFLTGGIDFDFSNRGCQALSYGSVYFIDEILEFSKYDIIVPGFYIRRRINDKRITVLVNDNARRLTYKYYWLPDIILTTILTKIFGRVYKPPYSRFSKDLNNVDYCFNISGGDSFSDIYGYKQFISLARPSLVAAFLKKKLILLPQTIGPFSKKKNFWIAKYILKRSFKIFIRDHEYSKTLDDMDIKYEYHPDVSFYMKPEQVDISIKKDSIGINVSGLAYFNTYRGLTNQFPNYKELLTSIIQYFQRNNKTVYLLPHTYNYKQPELHSDDLSASFELFDQLKTQDYVHVINNDYSAPQLKFIISKFSFFIGTRMHACFAAIFTSVPVFGLAYSYKFAGSFKNYGVSQCYSNICNIGEFQIKEILIKIIEAYANKEKLKTQLELKTIELNNIESIKDK